MQSLSISGITPVKAYKDNYIWIILLPHKYIHPKKQCISQQIIIVDPGEAEPVLAFLKENAYTAAAVLITHKHADHCAGIADILSAYSSFDIPVFGPAFYKIPGVTHYLKERDKVTLENFGELFEVINIPGHTLEHIAYYGQGVLFCGDTLFTGGCGQIFEGTPVQMVNSLEKLMQYPDNTLIYCGHEYTKNNLKFAQLIEPDNIFLQERIIKTDQLLNKNLSTVPSTLISEKQTNPFLRCNAPSVIHAVEAHSGRKFSDSVQIFAYLREWKNNF